MELFRLSVSIVLKVSVCKMKSYKLMLFIPIVLAGGAALTPNNYMNYKSLRVFVSLKTLFIYVYR